MRMPCRRTLLALAVTVPLHAMAEEPAAPATPEACVAIAADATRLACYDAALRHQGTDTLAADAAAKEAAARVKEEREAADTGRGRTAGRAHAPSPRFRVRP